MTVRLGNIDLDNNLRLKGLETAPDIAAARMIALDGTVDIITLPAPAKRELSLVALRNGNKIEGHYTLAQLEAVKAIARAGQPALLIHHRGSFNVLVVSTAGLTPVIDYRDPMADTKFVGTLLLLEV